MLNLTTPPQKKNNCVGPFVPGIQTLRPLQTPPNYRDSIDVKVSWCRLFGGT